MAEVPDITLPELAARLLGQGATVSVTALWRFFGVTQITRKNVWPAPSASGLCEVILTGLRQRIRSRGQASAKMEFRALWARRDFYEVRRPIALQRWRRFVLPPS